MNKSLLIVIFGIFSIFMVFFLQGSNLPKPSWIEKDGNLIISEENLQEPSPKDTDYQRSLKIINLEKRIKELEELLSKLVILKQDPYVVDTNILLTTNLKEVHFLSRY